MPIADAAREIVRSPEFQAMGAPDQLAAFRQWAGTNVPKYSDLSLFAQDDVARKAIEAQTPHGLEALALALPIIGNVLGAASSRAETPALVRAALPADAGPGLRFAATLAGEAALFVGSFGLGRIAAGVALQGASRLGVNLASRATAAAAVRGAVLGTGGAAAVDAAAGAALNSLKARLIGSGADAIAQAAVFEIGSAALDLRTPTVQGFAVNAGLMGAFGIALHGVGRARLKLGDRGFEEARRLVLASPQIHGELADSVRFAQLYARSTGKPATQATDDLFKLLSGQGDGAAAAGALDVLASNPAFLKPGRDFGTFLAAQIRGTLPGAQLIPKTGSNRLLITYHDAANPAIESTADLSFPTRPTLGPDRVFGAEDLRRASKVEKFQHKQLNAILGRARAGEIRINKVVGDDSLVARFDEFRYKRGPLDVGLAQSIPAAEVAAAVPEERVLNLDDFHGRQREELLLVADDLAAQARAIESEVKDLADQMRELRDIPKKLAAQAKAEGLEAGGFTSTEPIDMSKEIARLEARRAELAALPAGAAPGSAAAALPEGVDAPAAPPRPVGPMEKSASAAEQQYAKARRDYDVADTNFGKARIEAEERLSRAYVRDAEVSPALKAKYNDPGGISETQWGRARNAALFGDDTLTQELLAKQAAAKKSLRYATAEEEANANRLTRDKQKVALDYGEGARSKYLAKLKSALAFAEEELAAAKAAKAPAAPPRPVGPMEKSASAARAIATGQPPQAGYPTAGVMSILTSDAKGANIQEFFLTSLDEASVASARSAIESLGRSIGKVMVLKKPGSRGGRAGEAWASASQPGGSPLMVGTPSGLQSVRLGVSAPPSAPIKAAATSKADELAAIDVQLQAARAQHGAIPLTVFAQKKAALKRAAVEKLGRRRDLQLAVAEVAKQVDALPGGGTGLDPILAGLRTRQVAPRGLPLSPGERVATGAGEAEVIVSEYDPRGAVWRVGEDVGIAHPGKDGKPLTPRVDRAAAPIILSAEERSMIAARAIAWTSPDGGVYVTRPAGRGVIEFEEGFTSAVSRWKVETVENWVEHKNLVPLSGTRLAETNAEIAKRSLIVKQSRSARGFVDRQFRVAEQLGTLGRRLEAQTSAERLEVFRALTPDDVVVGTRTSDVRSGAVLNPINDSVGFLARALDAEARALPSGEVLVRYKWGDITYKSKSSAFRALREVQLHNLETQRIVAAAQRVAETDTFPSLPALLDWSDVLPGAPLDDEFELLGRHLGGESGIDLPIIRSFERVITRLARAGDPGIKAAALLQSVNRMRLQSSGTVLSEFERVFSTLTPEEIAYSAVDSIKRGLPVRPEVRAAHARLNEVLHKFLRTDAALGSPVAPFMPDYIPVVNDAETMELLRAGLEDLALGRGATVAAAKATDIVGQIAKQRGVTHKQATAIIKRATQNQQPRSGHLAFEREVSLPGLQMRNLRSIYTVAALRDARDVSAAKVLGAGHTKWEALLGTMDQATRIEAMRAYESVLGRGRSEMPAFAESLYNFQRTKLTFSGIANLVQNVNTAQVAGVRNFASAMWDLFKPTEVVRGFPAFRAARQRALDAGVLAHGLSGMLDGDDVHRFITKNEMVLIQKSFAGKIKAGYEHLASLPLRVTDIFNKAVGFRAGEIMFDRLMGRLDDSAISILGDLGFNRALVMKAQGERDVREWLRLEVAAKVADRSQFPASALNLPAAGISPITKNLRGTRLVKTEKTFFGSESGNFFQDSVWGRFLWQFQNFSMNQSAFFWREATAGFGALQKAARARGGIPALLRDPRALVATLRRPDVAPQMKRSAQMIGALLTAYPLGGALAVQVKAALAGPTGASQQLAALAENEDFASWLAYWSTATAAGGGIGMAGDLAAAAVTRNLDDIKDVFSPTALGTATDAVFTMASGLRFASTGDTEELASATRFFLGQVAGSPGRALAAAVVPR